jgi:acyl carrier protein
MNKNQILNEINNIFKDVLDNEEVIVYPETTSDDIDEWDSLTHIQLIVAIEKQFNLKFSSTEISNWKDVKEMIISIEHKLNNPLEKKIVKEVALPTTTEVVYDATIPSYKKNHITSFLNIKYGKNCFFSEGVTVKNIEVGDQVWINKYATVYSNYEKIIIGSNCYIGPYVWMEGHAGLELGNSVHIAGPGTSIYTHSGIKMALNGEHLGNPGYKPDIKSLDFRAPIRIGNNVWIGPNCSISPGVVIQDYVVVLPNTIVKSGIIESYSLVHGDGIVEKNSEFVKSFLIDNNQK